MCLKQHTRLRLSYLPWGRSASLMMSSPRPQVPLRFRDENSSQAHFTSKTLAVTLLSSYVFVSSLSYDSFLTTLPWYFLWQSDPGVHRHLVHQASFGVQWELVRYQNSPLGWRPSDIASDQEIRALSEATNVDGVEKLTALVEKKKGSASDKMSFESAFARERAAKVGEVFCLTLAVVHRNL